MLIETMRIQRHSDGKCIRDEVTGDVYLKVEVRESPGPDVPTQFSRDPIDGEK